MSMTIDEKVVEMRFDNRQFESGIETSINSLDKLSRSLDLSGASKGLEGVGEASRGLGVDMGAIGSVVETVGSKFSAMKIVAITALANITNSAVNAGKRILSSLTVEPVKAGFSEYELKMGSVQTIMSSTGESLETVNKYLEELNEYSDRTIYSFSDMTNNIGKFTNAGVKLEDAVTAIKGVSNVAALSGANANEASRAMYNFSQALSAGYVKLIDWKSIENANMATVGFKDELIKTALELGTVTDAGDGMYKTLSGKTFNATKNFNDVLQEQWMTTDVLVKTLGRYTDETSELGQKAYAAAQDIKTFSMLLDTLKESAQSGWAQTWEILFGDFEEAKVLWTDVNEVVGEILSKSADARNEMLKGWKELGGRKAIIDAIANAFHGVMAIVKPVGEAFREIFPAITAKQLYDATEKFRQLTENFKMFFTENEKGKKILGNIKSIFKGLFAAIDIGVQLVISIGKAFGSLLSTIDPIGDGLLGFAASLGDGVVELRDFIKSTKIFDKVLGSVAKALSSVISVVTSFVGYIVDGFKKLRKSAGKDADEFADKVESRFAPLVKLGEIISKVFGGVSDLFDRLGPIVVDLGKKLGKGIADLFVGMWDAVKNVDYNMVLDVVNGGLLAGFLVGAKKFVSKLGDMLDSDSNPITGFVQGFMDILGEIKGVFGSLSEAINTFTASIKIDMLRKVAVSIAILAASVIALSLVDSTKLAASLAVMTGLFVDLFGSMALFQKLMGKDGFKAMHSLTTQMMGIATATLVLSIALTILGRLDWKSLAVGLVGITSAMTALVTAAVYMSGKGVERAAKGMTSLALSVLIMAAAVSVFAKLSWEDLARGVVGMTAAMTALSVAASLISKKSTSAKTLLALAVSVAVLAGAMHISALLDWNSIGRGLVAMAGSLTILVVAMSAIPKSAALRAVALVEVSVALLGIAGALVIMGSMPWQNVLLGLGALLGSMGIMVAALNLIPLDAALKAAAIVLLASALMILAPSLALLGSLSLASIGKGLLVIAGVIAAFIIAAYALKGTELTLIAFAAALTALGVACTAVSAAVIAISGALVGLAGAGAAVVSFFAAIGGAGEVIVTMLTTILSSIVESIATCVPQILELALTLCDGLLTMLIDLTPRVFEWLGVLLNGLIKLIGDSIPNLVGMLGILLDNVLIFLVESVPKLVNTAKQMVLGFLRGIRDSIPEIMQAGAEILVSFADGILGRIQYLIDAGFKMVIDFCNGVADAIRGNQKPLYDAFANLADAMIDGLTYGLTSGLRNIGNTVKNVGTTALNALKKVLGIHSPSKEFRDIGKYTGKGYILGLKDTMSGVASATKDVGKTTINSLSDAVSHVADVVGSEMDMTPTIRPVIDLSDVESGEKELSKMLGKTKTISVDSATIRATSVARSMGTDYTNEGTNPTNQNGGTTFTFTQNNYSPKALSKTDIYRQTKNQFSLAKEAIKVR